MFTTEITFRDIDNTEAIVQQILAKASKLATFSDKIEYCQVTVEATQKHQHKGKLYRTHVEVGVPGKRLVANHKDNEDLYINIRDAFNATHRQLESHKHKQRGNVKHYH